MKRFNVKILSSFLLLILSVLGALATNKTETEPYLEKNDGFAFVFKQGFSDLDLSYARNNQTLEALLTKINFLKKTSEIVAIKITSGASPEGAKEFNQLLSEKRAETLKKLIQHNVHIADRLFVCKPLGENWDGLVTLVSKTSMSGREKVLNVVKNTPYWVIKDGEIVSSRKLELKKIDSGKIWWYMMDNIFPSLRSTVIVEIKSIPCLTSLDKISKKNEKKRADRMTYGSITEYTYSKHSELNNKRNTYLNLRTNALYDALLVPNIGVELYLGNNYSVIGSWMYAWWNNNPEHLYWRIYGGGLEARKYFGDFKNIPMLGHHLGVYAGMFTYDFELGGKGYLGEKWSYTAGISYGYTIPLAERLNIDFSLGIGYMSGKYYKYAPKEDKYYWKCTRNRHWFGPTKAAISLVWRLGRGNTNKKMGGKS